MSLEDKLRAKNGIKKEALKNDADKVRIAQLEEVNKELMDAVLELAEIVAGGK